MAEETKKTCDTKFDEFYYSDDKKRKEAMYKGSKKRLDRKLQSAYDSADIKIFEAEEQIYKLSSDIENYNVNAIIENRQTISELKNLQEKIKEEYKYIFDIEMKF